MFGTTIVLLGFCLLDFLGFRLIK